jgi:SP family arabinose:H+ symporter-like MFS transporter
MQSDPVHFRSFWTRVALLTKHPVGEAFAVSFGGFVFGYDLGALSSATQSLRSQFQLSPAIFGLTVSFSLWGTICGSLLAGHWADRMGRRNLVMRCALLYSLAAIVPELSIRAEWTLVLAMRFLCGMAIGGFTVGCPLYLSELAPTALRGRFVSMFQVQVGAGVVVAFAAGSAFAHFGAPQSVWRFCFGAGAIPAAVLFLVLRFMYKRDLGPADHIKSDPVNSNSNPLERNGCPGRERLFSKKNVRPILLATSIAIFNQLSGVNIVLLYMLDILSSAGIGLGIGRRYTVLISCLSLATTLLGMAFVDKSGRKPLLYIGSAGMAVCLLSLGIAIPRHFNSIVYLFILIAYNAFFAFSQGTVVWVYLSELFPPGIRGAGQGYGSSVHWIANAILVSVFPIMQHASSAGIFYLFALMMVLQVVVIWLWYPETRAANLGSLA